MNHERQAIIAQITALIPRYVLACYPTPLLLARRLTAALGSPTIWFKRDDLISFGLGGNKVRGLEVLLADALAQKASRLVTGAGVQSNHVRATAAVAAHAGLACTAVYWGKPPAHIDGNYRVTKMLGSDIFFTQDNDRESVDSHILQVADTLRQQGENPYSIPRGGASALGALGHILAVFELYQQCVSVNLQPDAIVFAVGSGGTYAGWLCGTKLLNLPWRLECYSVSREPEQVSIQVARLATEAAQLLQLDWQFSAADAPVHGGFIGAGYGIPSTEAAAAIRLVGRNEGLLLDPTYTGKAMAGLLDDLANEQFSEYQNIVFLHTGGEPAFFAGNGDWLNN
ncbi:MAG: pyridoxal-phosphate dependent enzyme [Methylococcales bacterium]|nr:pyridoxal-phosphate dependent enzyme [Methylococcales bacterium]